MPSILSLLATALLFYRGFDISRRRWYSHWWDIIYSCAVCSPTLLQLLPILTQDFTKEGWLSKTGPARGDAYRKRWFSLLKRTLRYYENPMVCCFFDLAYLYILAKIFIARLVLAVLNVLVHVHQCDNPFSITSLLRYLADQKSQN